MPTFPHCLDAEVTVHYPPTQRYPNGRVCDGVIVRRQNIARGSGVIQRYTVLFDDGRADTLLPPAWIKPRAQEAMPV